MFNLALITDPRSENAWLWLSTVAVDDAEKEDCLRQVLAINPKNVNAANELQKLSEKRRSELVGQSRSAGCRPIGDRNPRGGSRGRTGGVRGRRAAPTGSAARPRRRGGRAQMPTWLKYAIIGGFGLLIVLIASGLVQSDRSRVESDHADDHADAVADGHHSADLDLHAHVDANRLSAARVHGDAHQHADDHADTQRNADQHADADAHADESRAHQPARSRPRARRHRPLRRRQRARQHAPRRARRRPRVTPSPTTTTARLTPRRQRRPARRRQRHTVHRATPTRTATTHDPPARLRP